MKKLIITTTMILTFANSFSQIQEYFMNKERLKSYNWDVNAWESWSEWDEYNAYEGASTSYDVKISSNSISLIKVQNLSDLFTNQYIITPIENQHQIRNGYKLWVLVNIKEKIFNTRGYDKTIQYQGILYSYDSTWNSIYNNELDKHVIGIIVDASDKKFKKEFELNINSALSYKKEEDNKKAIQEKRINQAANLLNAILKKK